MKLVNVSDKPFEFQHDSRNYPALRPGEIGDYPDNVARHALKRSWALDDEGMPVNQCLEVLTPENRQAFAGRLLIACPCKDTDGCTEGPFKSIEEVSAHIQSHLDFVDDAKKPKSRVS